MLLWCCVADAAAVAVDVARTNAADVTGDVVVIVVVVVVAVDFAVAAAVAVADTFIYNFWIYIQFIHLLYMDFNIFQT